MSFIQPRKWPENVDITHGKCIGIVTSWNKTKKCGSISTFSSGYSNVFVHVEDIQSNILHPFLVPGEELEFNIEMVLNFHLARNVSGPNGGCVQCDDIDDGGRFEIVLR